MINFKRFTYSVAGFIIIAIILTACSSNNDNDTVIDSLSNEETISTSEAKPKSSKEIRFGLSDYQDYIASISAKQNFEPYYKTVFAFEMLPNGISSVPIEKVKSMYNEMKTTFDYVLISQQSLFYIGYYDGKTSFVDGYEEYQNSDSSTQTINPINKAYHDWDGNEILSTPLKTVMLGESVFNRFDNNIVEGRNLEMSDFVLKGPNEPISVVLGNEYMDIYKLGDILSLELISKVMNFKVVGFYDNEVSFSMDVGAENHISFNHTIVMPYFILDYEPIGEAAIFQHAYLLAGMTSGYIAIEESVAELSDNSYDIYTKYIETLEEIAEHNGISDLYKYPCWPVGFIW